MLSSYEYELCIIINSKNRLDKMLNKRFFSGFTFYILTGVASRLIFPIIFLRSTPPKNINKNNKNRIRTTLMRVKGMCAVMLFLMYLMGDIYDIDNNTVLQVQLLNIDSTILFDAN